MKQGGNLLLREYFEKYDLENEDSKVKFNTKASQFYRKRLAALASNLQFTDDEPGYDEGRNLSDGKPLPTKCP